MSVRKSWVSSYIVSFDISICDCSFSSPKIEHWVGRRCRRRQLLEEVVAQFCFADA